jgi:hypothetical protein
MPMYGEAGRMDNMLAPAMPPSIQAMPKERV